MQPSLAGIDIAVAQLRDEYEEQGLSPEVIDDFRGIIYGYFRHQGRTFPWRQTTDPYHILVSEFMLQQTRVETVQKYYPRFIKRYPDFLTLATSPFSDVLREWKGLGYNRRAHALLETSRIVTERYQGILPADEGILRSFPGIGKTTAAAICAFAFDQPVVLLETNIRTVFLYFFFHGQEGLTDHDILPLVERTLPPSGFREWYYALMDLGVWVKKHVGNPNRGMRNYHLQSRFEGSDRQIRGKILSILMEYPALKESEIQDLLRLRSPDYLNPLLMSLQKEGMLAHQSGLWSLTR